jgi:hypothetical protein
MDKSNKIIFSRRLFELVYLKNSSPQLQNDLDNFYLLPKNKAEVQVTDLKELIEVLHTILEHKQGRKEVHNIMAEHGMARLITDAEIARLKRPGGGHGQFCKSLHDFTSNGSKYVFINPNLH